MSRQHKILCGTPTEKCTGGFMQTGEKWRGSSKGHSTREEAKKCYVRYLKSIGYVQTGPNTFRLGDGPTLVISKTSKFGGVMRKGKEKRVMPKETSGVITSL